MIKRYLLACAAFLILFGITAAQCYGEDEDIVNFILPETPPTIERVKKPPLDQPFVRKQNFVSEFDISPSPVFLRLNFRKFVSQESPISIRLYNGGFASRGGSFVYSSSNSVDASYARSAIEGEYPNQTREKNDFRCKYERNTSPDKYYYIDLENTDDLIWNQHKDLLGIGSGFGWYLRENLNTKLGVSYAKGEIEGQAVNESVSANLSMLWQPFEGQNASLAYLPNSDTAIGQNKRFDIATARYDVMIFSRIVLGGGGRMTKDKFFGQGYLAAGLAPGLKFNVSYLPGIEKISWDRLYINDNYVKVNGDIAYPESVYNFTENISYYTGEKNSIELEVSQAEWKNYVLWESVTGTDFITPVNGPDVYVSCARLNAGFGGKALSCKISAEKNLNTNLTFVPDYKVFAELVAVLGTWSLGAGYKYTGPMYYLAGYSKQLGSSENMSVSLKKNMGEGFEFYACCDNLLSKRLESQPGFVRNAPIFNAGINIKL